MTTHTEEPRSSQEGSVAVNLPPTPPPAVQHSASIKPYMTPLAIFFGSVVIAAALYFGNSSPSVAQRAPAQNPAANAPQVTVTEAVLRRAEAAHIYGNPNAETTIVEFSDYECPFCARLHPTLKTVVDESGGAVNWEYRHLPLPNHPNARPGAIASECVAKYAGGDAFWSFTDAVFNAIGTQNAAFFEREALARGVSAADYRACITDPAMARLVDEDAAAAAASGGRGTPHSVIITPEGDIIPVSGAVPLEQWRALLAAN